MPKAIANPEYKPISHPTAPYKTFDSFYPFYLGEHSNRFNRIFHLCGTSIALTIYGRIGLSILSQLVVRTGARAELARNLRLTGREVGGLLAVGLLQGYALAWLGHFFVEKNRPATFKYPLFSLRGDFRMLWEVITLQRAI